MPVTTFLTEVAHDDVMAVSDDPDPPTGESTPDKCLDLEFFSGPPAQPGEDTTNDFFATTVDGPFVDGGTDLGFLVGPVTSFSAGGKLWTLVPKNRTGALPEGCSPGLNGVSCALVGDQCLDAPNQPLIPPVGKVCFTGACDPGDNPTSRECYPNYRLGTPNTDPPTSDTCQTDSECGAGNRCLELGGCYRGTFENGPDCDATDPTTRSRCLPRLNPGTLGVMLTPTERMDRPECDDTKGDVTNCLRRIDPDDDIVPGAALEDVVKPYERFVVTSAAIDPESPVFQTRVLVWGREHFLAARVDDPLETDWSPLDVYLWRHLVTGGLIAAPEYWCEKCLPNGASGFTTEIDKASPVIRERQHVIGGQMNVFWAPPIQKWVMIYGGRLPFVTLPGELDTAVVPSLTSKQVFDPEAGIYLRYADSPEGLWSEPRTIFNPFDQVTFGYCEIMYFSDVPRTMMSQARPTHIADLVNRECPTQGAIRSAQQWWEDKTLVLPPTAPPPQPSQESTRRIFGAEYGAAVLPTFIGPGAGGDGVSFHWLMSTWNPYRVVIMKTEFDPL